MIQYLLGELHEAWQSHFEEQFFTNPDYYEQLKVAEDNLIDDYVCGRLSAERRERFEQHFLISERRRQKTEFTRTLCQTLAQVHQPVSNALPHPLWRGWRGWFRWRMPQLSGARLAWSGLALIFVIGSGWLVLEIRYLRGQQAQLQAEVIALKKEPTAPTPAPPSQPDPGAARSIPEDPPPSPTVAPSERIIRSAQIVIRMLRPGRVRDIEEQGNTPSSLLNLPAGVRTVRLQLLIGQTGSFPDYRATLMTAEGESVLLPNRSKPIPSADQQILIFEIPAALLTKADYVLTLSGVSATGQSEELEDYHFTVVK